jgi:hypothetical protein
MGLVARPLDRHRKSSKKVCTWRPRHTRGAAFALWRKSSCSKQNNPHAPGNVSAIERSCYLLVEVQRRLVGMPSRTVCSRSTLYGVSWVVLDTVQDPVQHCLPGSPGCAAM